MNIDRCVCFQKTFAQLLHSAKEHDCTSLNELRKHVEFGNACGLCNLYVERALETGEVVFHEVISE